VADDVTPTNGINRGSWTRHLPIGLALAAATGAGVGEARIESVQDQVKMQSALDARVRTNSEHIAAHELQSSARWDEIVRRLDTAERRLDRLERRADRSKE
jgi:hypothetical protein